MNALVFTLSLICGIMFYGNGLPYHDLFSKYQNRDDYYEDYYLRKIPKLKTSPEKVKDFFQNHLSWFPADALEAERNGRRHQASGRHQKRRTCLSWNLALEEPPEETKPKHHRFSDMKAKLKHRFKNFTQGHHIPTNWTSLKSESSKSIHKVEDYVKHRHITQVLKNVTHPLRYRGPHEGNHSKTQGNDLGDYKCVGPHIRIHPKSSHVEVIKTSTPGPRPEGFNHPQVPELPDLSGLPDLSQIPDLSKLPDLSQIPELCNCNTPSPKPPKHPSKPSKHPPTSHKQNSKSPKHHKPKPSPTPKNSGNPPPTPPNPDEPENLPPTPPNPEGPGNPPPTPPDPEKPGNPPLAPLLPNNPENVPPQVPNFNNPPPLFHPESLDPPPQPPVPRLPGNPRLFPSDAPLPPLPPSPFGGSPLERHHSRPRKIKVVIDMNSPEKATKTGRNVNSKSYLPSVRADGQNSSKVLATAGEMASDLAGRVRSLWHSVVGSHRVPDIRDVNFYLYTRRNVIRPELLKVNYDLIEKKVKANPRQVDLDCLDLPPEKIGEFERISDENREIIKSNFLNIRAPTKILIHGYTGSYKDSRMAKIKDAYLNSGRYNVIQVDWEILAAPPCYIRVTRHSKFVGETIGHFLNGLYLVGLNMSMVHLVGFSLGAQVAGFAGNNATIAPLCRITGLDPALPLFLHTEPSGHLDRLDAKFVDVIHTCGGILAMLDPLGHVDFYPNGGTRQPGCDFSNLKCSHSRAPQYFAESIVSQKKFTGQLCLTWEEFVAGDCNNTTDISYMGEPCSRRSVLGKYYLLTKSKEPFVV